MKTLLDHLNTHEGRLPWLLVLLGLNHTHAWWDINVLGFGLVLLGGSLLLDKLNK